MSTRIDPVTLRLVVAVMDTGTISGAADREHIAPSAVSKRLSDLEDSLNTALVQRTNRGIEPTAAGLELLGLARSVLNDLDNIHLRLSDYASGAKGLVRVFANISAITEFLPQRLRTFTAQYPNVQVQLQERISSGVQQGVASNAADVGLYAHGKNIVNGLVSRPFEVDELVVVVPIDHPLAEREAVSIAETLKYEYVGLHTGSFINHEILKAANECDMPFRCRVQVTSFDALSLMVEAGMGIAVMPRMIGLRYSALARIKVLALDEPWACRELRICVRSFDSLSVAAQLFVGHLSSKVQL